MLANQCLQLLIGLMIFHEARVRLDKSLSLEEKEKVVGWWVELWRYDNKAINKTKEKVLEQFLYG